MRSLKALTGTLKNLSSLYLHILLTEENGVIVARCLDFSVSSHGENEQDALDSLSDSILDYLDYALKHKAFADIIDPEEDKYWNMFREKRLKDETIEIKKNVDILKKSLRSEVCYV